MVTYHQLRDVDAGIYRRQAEKWSDFSRRASGRGDDVQRHLDSLADWIGPASESAKAELGLLRNRLRDMATELNKIPPVLTTLSDTIAGLQRTLHGAADDAVAQGFQFHAVGDDGTVIARAPLPHGPADGARKLADDLTITFKDLLRRANEADATATTELGKLTALATGFAPSSDYNEAVWDSITIPARGASPEDVKKWWDGLSIQQREALLFNEADIIGAMDGIPAEVRDRANRSLLPGMTEHMREEIAILEARHPISTDDKARLDQLRGELDGVQRMTDRLEQPPDGTHQQAYLLKIDTEGLGRAIVAVGNPDTATNVATYVPGTGTRLQMAPADIDRADAMVAAAKDADRGANTAVITYMDYKAPQSLVGDAPFPEYANAAKEDLRDFQHGLRVTHDSAPSHNTMIGHSYGGEVVGFAARDGAVDADALVFVAAPTVGVDEPADLHLTGVDADEMSRRVYHTVGDNDPMRILANENRNSPDFPGREPNPPATDGERSFGGVPFASDPGTGHSDYWKNENGRMSTSLRNMGLIIAGKQPVI